MERFNLDDEEFLKRYQEKCDKFTAKEVTVTAKNKREAVKKAKAKFLGKLIKKSYFDNDATGVVDEYTQY